MKFGHFDDKNKEYVITRPDTPRSWSNYLGSTDYGAIITNNAGGYSFYKSGAQGRFTRLRFNSIPADQPGRIIYLRDADTGDYWSNAWQPVGKSLSSCEYECRHGSAYTKISAKYKGIVSETLYFVPHGKNYEVWHLKVKNAGDKPRKLSLFSFVEYANNWNAFDDQINLQYTQYIVKMDVKDGIIDHGTNVNIPSMPDNFQEKDQGRHTFLGVNGVEVSGYDTDRETFIGRYRTYANPAVVEEGKCKGTLASGDNACGTLQSDITLQPGEEKEITYVMGIGEAATAGKEALAEMASPEKVNAALKALKAYWHERIEGIFVETPDPLFNSMMNMWTPFNSLITFAWSRAASLVYAGERDGFGYRDTVQDLLGIMHTIPEEAKARLELMLTGQVATGGAMPIVKPFAHIPGKEKAPSEEEYRSDDCMWLFNAVTAYVNETGDKDFYTKILPFADEGEATVFGHLKRAIEFNLERSGAHALPCGLLADWNDCLELGHDGETVFVAMQLRFALKTYAEIAEVVGDEEEQKWTVDQLAVLDKNLQEHTWEGNQFLRAFRNDGFKFGSTESEEGNIFLNPQTWSVISGHANQEQAEKVMESVHQKLATDYGLMICDPPYIKTDYTVIRATLMNPGMKENGGIFCHTQGWAVMAESLLGHGNRAFEYYKAFMPAAYNERAEEREIEPYVYCQSTHSKYSPRYGASRVPWLSGTATWAYFSATQYILGLQPRPEGFVINPCIPSNWKGFKVSRIFRHKKLNITVENPSNVEKGVKSITLNGSQIEGNLIPAEAMKGENEITVVMG